MEVYTLTAILLVPFSKSEFLPHYALQATAVYAVIFCLSVCSSVCLSVTY